MLLDKRAETGHELAHYRSLFRQEGRTNLDDASQKRRLKLLRGSLRGPVRRSTIALVSDVKS